MQRRGGPLASLAQGEKGKGAGGSVWTSVNDEVSGSPQFTGASKISSRSLPPWVVPSPGRRKKFGEPAGGLGPSSSLGSMRLSRKPADAVRASTFGYSTTRAGLPVIIIERSKT